MFGGVEVMELGPAVVATDVGVAAGPERAAKTMKIGTSAQIGSPVICALLSF